MWRRSIEGTGIDYDKVVAAHGNPIPFLRKGSREELRSATGSTKLPALRLPNGQVITHSRKILAWIEAEHWRVHGRYCRMA